MKVAICIVHYGDVKADFSRSLGRLLIATLNSDVSGPDGPIKLELELFFRSSSVLVASREEVVGDAFRWGAEWLLLCDSDHSFPPLALLRLIAHGKPAVGCNYMRRGPGKQPVIPVGSGLAEVEELGLGFFLVHRAVFDAMAQQAKAAGRDTALPLFDFTRINGGAGIEGEDIFFVRKIRAAGFPVFCDHDLSLEIGHFGEVELRLPQDPPA